MATPLNVGRYQLYLNAARRGEKLNLAVGLIEFDPNKHPRGAHGHFTKALNKLEVGKSMGLPDGVKVTRRAKGFEITGGSVHPYGPDRERLDKELVTGGGWQGRLPKGEKIHADTPTMASKYALQRSAANTHERSFAGDKQLLGPNAHTAELADPSGAQTELERLREKTTGANYPEGKPTGMEKKSDSAVKAMAEGAGVEANTGMRARVEAYRRARTQANNERQQLKDMTDESMAPHIDKMSDQEVKDELAKQQHEADRAGEGGTPTTGGDGGYKPGDRVEFEHADGTKEQGTIKHSDESGVVVTDHEGTDWNYDHNEVRPIEEQSKPAHKLSKDEAAAELDRLGDKEMQSGLTAEDHKRIKAISKKHPGLADEAAGSSPGSGPVR